MTTATVDLEALQADEEARVTDLRGQRQQLAPEALRTKTAAAHLARVEEALHASEQKLERIRLARAENARRSEQAEIDAAAERRAAALQRARELQAERQRQAKAVDAAARRFAEALAAWDRSTTEQERALREAGWTMETAIAARPHPALIEGALQRALTDANCPAGIIRLESSGSPTHRGRPSLLADGDARLIEPAEPER